MQSGPIRVATLGDGTLTYLVDLGPESLPAVRARDLARAWERAHEAAHATQWGGRRLFRFRRDDGQTTDLALADDDACCWAAAVESDAGLKTSYGLSLCLRLLALIALLAEASWAAAWFPARRDATAPHPALLAAAAAAPLNAAAQFDEAVLLCRIAALHPLAAPLHSGVPDVPKPA